MSVGQGGCLCRLDPSVGYEGPCAKRVVIRPFGVNRLLHAIGERLNRQPGEPDRA